MKQERIQKRRQTSSRRRSGGGEGGGDPTGPVEGSDARRRAHTVSESARKFLERTERS